MPVASYTRYEPNEDGTCDDFISNQPKTTMTIPKEIDERLQREAKDEATSGRKTWSEGYYAASLAYKRKMWEAEARVSEQDALILELVEALELIGPADEHSGSICEAIAHSRGMLHEGYESCPGIRAINAALAKAKAHLTPPTT